MTPPRSFLLQMAGMPGSGKSSLAKVIAHRTGAIVIDKDVLKTAIMEAGVTESASGGVSYEVFFAIADHLLGQGWPVVLDSPSFWETIPHRGEAIARRRAVPYHFIECVCEDREELARRLRERKRLASQPGDEILDADWETVTPPGAYLKIDTTQQLERCLALALEYLGLDAV